MSLEQQKRILKLEGALARCQNDLESERRKAAQAQQRAKAKAKAKRGKP